MAWQRSNPYVVAEDYDARENEIFFDVRVVRKPSPRWEPLVADCLHNYRSALDHTIWVLTERYGTATARRVFPVHLTRAKYREKLRGDIGRTGRCGAKAIIERFQPYKRGNGGDHNPLWLLHELDRFAKHRILGELVVRFLPYDLGIAAPPASPSVSFDDHIEWVDPNDRNAMTVHVQVFSHPLGEVKVNFAPILGVGLLQPHLNHPGPLPLLRTLQRIGETVPDVLGKLEPICDKP
jgi:hypothetical protein